MITPWPSAKAGHAMGTTGLRVGLHYGLGEEPELQMTTNKKTVEIFTDGACSGNPGPGAYGSILRYGRKTKEISGYDPRTTNNRMEMTAVIEALSLLKRPCKIRIVTDSNYVVKGMTQWLPGWIKRNWTNTQKKPVLNKDLWEKLMDLSKPHEIEWIWIRGHAGHKENERCDELAKEAMRTGMRRKKKTGAFH